MRAVKLKQLVHLMVILQIAVATALLAMGESSPLLPLLALAVLAAATYFTDWTRRFELSQRYSDGLALAIMCLTALAALRTDRQGLLVLVANLQSYLQFVLMFQRKKPRIYWQLALLSLGQVAIASTLVPGPAFGFMMLLYLLLGIVGFALLLLYTEARTLAAAEANDDHVDAHTHVGGPGRLVLEGGTLSAEPVLLCRGLARIALVMSALTVVLASLMFVALPRWSVANFESTSSEPLRTVGFSSTVMLGELGEVIENPDVVMRVSFYRGRGDRAFQLTGEPLFRGTVVTRYEGRTWTQPLPSYPVELPTESSSAITRQRIQIEPLDAVEVFHVAPAVAMEGSDSRLRVDPVANRLFRLDEYRDRTIEFDIGTTGISGNRQRTVLPCSRPAEAKRRQLLQPFGADAAEEDSQPFPLITELATQILSDRGIDPQQNRVAAARALSDYFHLSGEFFYSLDPQPRDEALDPLEDFVSAHRGGHCEYFAGALVMMLRSQGIPARMVIGFKGGEWNEVGHYYQVQQLHAHAWVEVYLEEEQIPPGEFAGEQPPEAAWLVLDPTEGTREGAAGAGTGFVARLRQSIDYGRVLWINYVASLNAKRQRQDIYEPLAAGVEAAVDNLTSPEVWRERVNSLERSRVGRFWSWYRRHWFSWRGGLVAVGLLLVLLAAVVASRAAVRALLRRGWLGKPKEAEAAPVLEMYRRLETALAELGLSRQPAQTAREFALVAGGELAERLEHRRLAALPGRIVSAFYQVRFGGRTLDKPEAEAVEHALAELELALGRSR
jgi:transglutaminase-like putative cysteine protease